MTITRWNPEIIYAQIAGAYKQAAAVGLAAAKVEAPSASGELRRSIVYIPTSPLSGVLTSPVKHAGPQNTGAGAHTIAPVRKKALYNKRLAFGPVKGPVNHPGNPAKNFLSKGQDAFVVAFIAALRRMF
jgi:hypothetical protein